MKTRLIYSMTGHIQSRNIARLLLGGVAVLSIFHLLACIPHFFMGRGYPFAPFNLDIEASLPTLYSVLLFFTASLLYGAVGWFGRQVAAVRSIGWLLFAGAFGFVMVDEFIEIHEKLVEPIRVAFDTQGMFYFAWVIPYLVAGLVFLTLTLRFIRTLPENVRHGFYLGIACYVSAILVEMVEGAWVEHHDRRQLYYLFVWVEETLEMAGTVVFIRAALQYIEQLPGGLILHIGANRPDAE